MLDIKAKFDEHIGFVGGGINIFLKIYNHEHYFDFFALQSGLFYTKNNQKVNFSSNCAYIFPQIEDSHLLG